MIFTLYLVVASTYLANMDDKWFKAQQKRAGVTAEDIGQALGRDRSVVSRIYTQRQPMTAAQAKIFAQILQTPLSEVMERAGILEAEEADNVRAAISNGDVSQMQSSRDQNSQAMEIARNFGGHREGMHIWKVRTDAMSLGGYLPGDMILVDTTKSEIVRAGDIVIAQKFDVRAGDTVTLLRRFEPPVLVAASSDSDNLRVHVVDGENVVIKGKIVASWRSP